MYQLSKAPALRRGLAWLVPSVFGLGLVACGGGSDVGSAGPVSAKTASTITAVGFNASTNYVVKNTGVGGHITPKGINDSGQVAGRENYQGDGRTPAFFFDGATLHSVAPLPGGNSVNLEVLNNSGKAAGYSNGSSPGPISWTLAGGTTPLISPYSGIFPVGIDNAGSVVASHLFGRSTVVRWNASGDFITLGNGTTNATDISDAGEVVGNVYTSGDYRPVMWDASGNMTVLPHSQGDYSLPQFVNSAQQIAGYYYNPEGKLFPFYWSASSGRINIPVPNAEGLPQTGLDGLNNLGQVLFTSLGHTYVWSVADGLRDLGTIGGPYSWGVSINDRGEVIGKSLDAANQERPFIWTAATGMVNLQSRIPSAPAGTILSSPLAISNNGTIAIHTSMGIALLTVATAAPAAPTVGTITAADPLPVRNTMTVSAPFVDKDTSDTHTASINWGDGTTASAGTVTASNGSGTVSASHAYAAAGVYEVRLTVTDNTGLAATSIRKVVVYDPAAGFVTGGGWIQSPAGAYKADELVTGRAEFGFVSQYKKGATVPTGETEFRFKTAGLNFFSKTYEWLVVGGARAQYKGSGSINGESGYKFILTAVDGAKSTTKADRFRIKIWKTDAATNEDVVAYDNQVSASGEGSDFEGTVLGGGNVMIHSK